MTAPQVAVLCVDDDFKQLEALSRVLRNRFQLVTATDPREALDLVRASPQFAVVVSDLRMPAVDGITFLSQVREVAPDSVGVLLTGNADLTAAIAAVNQGHVFRFLRKPCPPDLIVATVQAAAAQHQLIVSERELLERTLHGSVAALTDVLALAQPAAFGRANRLKRLVAELAEALEAPNRWEVELAAMLSQIGCIGLPAVVAEKLSKGESLNEEESRLATEVPEIAARIIREVPRLEGVRDMILCQRLAFTPPPGAGQDRRGEHIPLGARLLGLALDFDELVSQGFSAVEAVRRLKARAGWYDPVVLARLAHRYEEDDEAPIQEVQLGEVGPGMIFVDDVRTTDGVLLVSRGHEVTESLVSRIHTFWAGLSVAGPVRVTRALPMKAPEPASS